ncbi:MAG: uracil-DNA glycosylase, partial [Candidatus Puniceispirillaceae bacterium]
ANRPARAPAVESQEQEPASRTRPSSSLPETAPAPIPAPAPVRQPAAPPPELAGIASLEELRTALEAFEGCALKHTASNMIFADGNPAARLMVIGEVPGRDEDRIGLPLVGGAGQLFDRMLASIGLSRADAYATTLIPWRPPGNRTPTDEEMDILMPWLCRHIQLADPDCILLLGGAPAKALLGQAGGILKLRGRWHDLDAGDGVARRAMATLHPAYLLRSPAQKRLAYTDLLALAAELG